MRHWKHAGRLGLAAGLLLLNLGDGGHVQAQTPTAPTPAGVIVHSVQGAARSDQLAWQSVIRFSLKTADGAVFDGTPTAAKIIVAGQSTTVEPQRVTPRLAVALLLDVTAALPGGYSRGLKDLLEALPETTTVALVPFGAGATGPVTFVSGRQAAEAVAAIKVVSQPTACPADALSNLYPILSALSGQKAVVIVTASTPGEACRLPQLPDDVVRLVVAAAGERLVMAGPYEAFAAPPGGIVWHGSVANWQSGVQTTFEHLRDRWEIRADVYPTGADDVAELRVTLEDGTVIAGTTPLRADRGYVRPPRFEIDGVESFQTYVRINLVSQDISRLPQLAAEFIAANNRNESWSATAPIAQALHLPSDGLRAGATYTLTLTALDAASQPIPGVERQTTGFRYEPAPFAPQLLPLEIGRSPTLLVVTATLTQTNGEAIRAAHLLLAAAENAECAPPVLAEATVPGDQPLRLEAHDLPSGNYVLCVLVLSPKPDQPGLMISPPFAFQRPAIALPAGMPRWAVGLLLALGLLGLISIGGMLLARPRLQRRGILLALPRGPRRDAGPTTGTGPAAGESALSPPQIASLRPIRLRLIEPANPVWSLTITRSPVTVGRRAECEASLPLDGGSGVSGRHLSLRWQASGWQVRDEHSTYGVRVDGHAIPPGEWVSLRTPARLGLGPRAALELEEVLE